MNGYYILTVPIVVLAFVALSGRETQTRWTRNPFLGKLKKADGRPARQYISFVVYLLMALIAVSMGLEKDGLLSGDALKAICTVVVLVIFGAGIIGALVVHHSEKKRPKGKQGAKAGSRTRKPALQQENTVVVSGVSVTCGVTTPRVFDGTACRVAYETLVQEPELPFITCELRTADGNRYLGDLLFEPDAVPVTAEALRDRPVLQLHLDNRVKNR